MYLDTLDIANRALQHCGVPRILSVTEDSKANLETSSAYDKVRRAELQRNTWRFATRSVVLRPLATTTMRLLPLTYDNTLTYLIGAIVQDTNGQYWMSSVNGNVNNPPGSTDAWEMYFGNLAISLWDSTVSYMAGELVYKAGVLAGDYNIFMSLVSQNTDTPDAATAWSATTTYGLDDSVSSGGFQWRSRLPFNLNVTPAIGPPVFDLTATYATSDQVTGSDNHIYTSVGSGNIGHDPTTDAGVHWTDTATVNGWVKTPTVPTAAVTWRKISASMKNFALSYPIGSGPFEQSETRNVFRLPAGYLKVAPQDPKAGSTSFLGAPSGVMYEDWNFESNFIVSSETGPILFRFIADITRVTNMTDMFIEGLACRIAEAVCEPLTQSNSKLVAIQNEYVKFMGEARVNNMIEVGAVEPPLDDWIACRV